jgi:hypothetical protein
MKQRQERMAWAGSLPAFARRPLGLALAVVPLSLVGGIPGGRWWLPLWTALLAFPCFLAYLREGEWGKGLRAMAVWSAALAAGVILATVLFPERMEEVIWRGAEYREEMFGWLASGQGAEGDWRQFLPQHLLHASLFVVAAGISAGFLGLVMGTLLMNYMAFYVGALVLQAEASPMVLLLAWPPWAMLRVVAFLMLAFPVSAWLWRRPLGLLWPAGVARRFLLAALILLVTDLVLKYSLAPVWRIWLKQGVGL